jgi:hypothetical protein
LLWTFGPSLLRLLVWIWTLIPLRTYGFYSMWQKLETPM